MMNVKTTRNYDHNNGYSGEDFQLQVETVDGAIARFQVDQAMRTTQGMRLLGEGIIKLADKIDSTEGKR